jgi:hypothetical protein
MSCRVVNAKGTSRHTVTTPSPSNTSNGSVA